MSAVGLGGIGCSPGYASAAEVALSPPDLERLDALAPRTAWSEDRQAFAARTTRASS